MSEEMVYCSSIIIQAWSVTHFLTTFTGSDVNYWENEKEKGRGKKKAWQVWTRDIFNMRRELYHCTVLQPLAFKDKLDF